MMHKLARQATGVMASQQDDERFGAAMQLLEAFLAQLGRGPDAWADDSYEARPGSWLDDQWAAERQDALPPERRQRLAHAAGITGEASLTASR